jgi:double-stranded uracil-DNA glycosylase
MVSGLQARTASRAVRAAGLNAVPALAVPPRPTPAELAAAAGRRVPDLVAVRLDVLFVGINPGLYSAATGHHFARPGNRFWPALHDAGFTEALLRPWEEHRLLRLGFGITNLVARATAAADELSPDELRRGRRLLGVKVRRFRPRCVAMLGIGAFRTGFERPRARIGPQAETLEGAALWVLPNPSGLNANHQRADLAREFRRLRRFARARRGSR